VKHGDDELRTIDFTAERHVAPSSFPSLPRRTLIPQPGRLKHPLA
jgi:hypothetical protein